MENNRDRPKPRIHFCGVKIESAVNIAFLLGFLLWSTYCAILFFGFPTAFEKLFAIFCWLPWSILAYGQIYIATNRKRVAIENNYGMHICESTRLGCMILSLCIMAMFISQFAYQSKYFIHELRRTQCVSNDKCPEWSNRCSKNFAKFIAFEAQGIKSNCTKHCPNEGVVERIFEGPENLRLLKRKILEMAANHKNLTEMLLESQLKPYFDNEDAFDSIEDMEANCELERGKWTRKVLCEEKVAKLKQAFMDIYWAQVKKKQQWKMNSTIDLEKGQITEDGIDSTFVVPYECDLLHFSLAISVAFLIGHLVIFVFFIWTLPYFKWLDWATKCPIQCFDFTHRCRKLCQHCPMQRMQMEMERNGQDEENCDRPSFRSELANCLNGPKNKYNKMKYKLILPK